jgi:FdhE protein
VACGGAPLLGELRGVELRLFLRCAACGLAWRSRRLFCPFCETDDHQLLQTLRVQGDLRFSAQLCTNCHAYLKIGNAFEPPPAALLALDDLASVDLDAVAIQRGYARPRAGFRLGHPRAAVAAY